MAAPGDDREYIAWLLRDDEFVAEISPDRLDPATLGPVTDWAACARLARAAGSVEPGFTAAYFQVGDRDSRRYIVHQSVSFAPAEPEEGSVPVQLGASYVLVFDAAFEFLKGYRFG